jgi:hypothetical protein
MKMRKIVWFQLLVGKQQSSVSIGGVYQAHQSPIKVPALVMELARMYVDKSHAKINIELLGVS